MSTQHWQRLCVHDRGAKGLLDAWYHLSDTSIELRMDGDNKPIDIENPEFVIHMTKDTFGEASSLRCCVDCIHFEQSGMSRDMGTALRGSCAIHKTSVDLFFQCNQLRTQDSLRPNWDSGSPNLDETELAFSTWLNHDQPFVVFENGTILVEDPNMEIGNYRCAGCHCWLVQQCERPIARTP